MLMEEREKKDNFAISKSYPETILFSPRSSAGVALRPFMCFSLNTLIFLLTNDNELYFENILHHTNIYTAKFKN